MTSFAFGRCAAMSFVCDSLIISFVPQMTNVGTVIRDKSDGLIFGSFTIKPSISAFLLASSDLPAKRLAILYPISIGICVAGFTPVGSRFPPFRIRAFTIPGCFIANFIADDVDLMVGVATPVAIQMQSATEDNQIPVVFAAVSDPVGSKLVESLEAPGANITGTSDYLDTAAVLNLIFAANPDANKIALLYNPSEDASTAPIAAAKEILGAKGVEVKEYTGTNQSEVMIAVSAIIGDEMDAVFTPTDNTIMDAELSIYEQLAEAKIPHYTGADSFALNGAFLGYGVDYANLGRETGDMVAAILLDGAKPGETAVRTFDNGTATVNTETCAAIGFDFETIKAAFAPFCTQVKEIKTAESFE